MSSSDPPPSDRTPYPPPPMTPLAAVGWTVGVTFGFILLRTFTLAARPGSEDDLVAQVACQAAAYLLGLFLILRVHAPDASIRDLVGLRSTNVLFYPLALALGAALEVPADSLYDIICRRFPREAADHFSDAYRDASSLRRAAFAAAIVLVGPALEEMIFRGAIFRLLTRARTAELAIVVTAALFAFAHVETQMLLPIGIVGLALAFVRRASGSIVPSFLLHAGFNGVSFVLMARSRPGAPDTSSFPPTAVAAASGVALVLVGLVYLVGSRSAAAQRGQELDRR